MVECAKCGISDSKTNLVTAISKEGIVKVCAKCAISEGMPIIAQKNFSPEKTNEEFIAERHDKGKTVYNRLSKIVGMSSQRDREKMARENDERIKLQNQELRKLVGEKPEKKIVTQKREDLADNFHWVIMRARRARKITQRDLAKAISESEQAIKLAEEGKIGLHEDALIDKIENYLGIRIRKDPTRELATKRASATYFDTSGNFHIDPYAAKNIKISDVRTLSGEKRKEAVTGISHASEKKQEVSSEKKTGISLEDDKPLTQDELDEILGKND